MTEATPWKRGGVMGENTGQDRHQIGGGSYERGFRDGVRSERERQRASLLDHANAPDRALSEEDFAKAVKTTRERVVMGESREQQIFAVANALTPWATLNSERRDMARAALDALSASPGREPPLNESALEKARHAITGIYELRWGYPGEPTRGVLDARAVASVAISTYLAALDGAGGRQDEEHPLAGLHQGHARVLLAHTPDQIDDTPSCQIKWDEIRTALRALADSSAPCGGAA